MCPELGAEGSIWVGMDDERAQGASSKMRVRAPGELDTQEASVPGQGRSGQTTVPGPHSGLPAFPPEEPSSHAQSADDQRYRSLGPIAAGGTSIVNRAHDSRIGREVALKRLRPELEGSEMARRFWREAQLTAWLDHPHIVPIYDVLLPEEGPPGLVMKLVAGRTLSRCIRESVGDLSSTYDLLTALRKVCDAIQFAHDHQVIHRDIKPENIMVGDRGEVFVMDWGIAKAPKEVGGEEVPVEPLTDDPNQTQAGSILGSPAYMSPEQANGDIDSIDVRTDVFGLGTVLYEILTGVPPYGDTPTHRVMAKAMSADIVPPRECAPDRAIRPDLEEICLQALRERPEDRFQTVAEYADRLRKAMISGSWFERRNYPPGSVVIREGDTSEEAFLIKSGVCRVTMRTPGGDEEWIRDMTVGEVFGEAGLLTGERRSATVIAQEDVEVECINRQSLEWAFSEQTALGILARSLANRFLTRERELMRRDGPKGVDDD